MRGVTPAAARPAGDAGAWHATGMPGGDSAAAIACPAEQLCVAPSSHSAAVDTWIDPRPGRGWVHTELPRGAAPARAVGCSVGGGMRDRHRRGGRVLTSTDPAAGGASYVAHRVTATGTPAITAVTCPATGGCLPATAGARSWALRDPAGPAPGAGPERRPRSLDPVDRLRSSGGCVAVASRGRLYARAAGARPGCRWRPIPRARCRPSRRRRRGGLQSDGFCVTADGTGALPRSATPFTASGWRTGPPRTDAGGRLSGIACPSLALCVAVGSGGEAVASRTPLRAGSWRTVTADRVDGVRGVSCPSTAFWPGHRSLRRRGHLDRRRRRGLAPAHDHRRSGGRQRGADGVAGRVVRVGPLLSDRRRQPGRPAHRDEPVGRPSGLAARSRRAGDGDRGGVPRAPASAWSSTPPAAWTPSGPAAAGPCGTRPLAPAPTRWHAPPHASA